VSDDSSAVLQGQLERALTGDVEARQRLLELTCDRLAVGRGVGGQGCTGAGRRALLW
jgi:hypothetical protein